MKTTLDINDQLLADAKTLAAQQRTSLTRLIEEGLQLRLRAQAVPRRGKLRLPVYKGRGGMAVGGSIRLATRRCWRHWAMTPDVNVLVAASRSDHPHHAIARSWLEQAAAATPLGSTLVLMPMVIASFLRLVSSPKIF
jgi:hypothetical protein